jgi:dihydrofolate reductase
VSAGGGQWANPDLATPPAKYAVSGDPFRLGEVLDTGALLLGRRTWELFTKIWPGRDDPFSAKMNAMPKLVASRTLEDAAVRLIYTRQS